MLGAAAGYGGLLLAERYIAVDIMVFNRRIILAVGAYGLLVGARGGL